MWLQSLYLSKIKKKNESGILGTQKKSKKVWHLNSKVYLMMEKIEVEKETK